MLKYVYEETKYLNINELIEALKNINYVNPTKEQILANYGVDIENTDLDDIEAALILKNFKKDINLVFSYLDFDLLDLENVDNKQKDQLITRLVDIGVNVNDEDLDSLKNVMQQIKNNTLMIVELNKSEISCDSLKLLLKKYNISYTNQDVKNVIKIIDALVYTVPVFLPTIKDKYYDQNNNLISLIDVKGVGDSKLKSFTGEILEKLDFKDSEDIKRYVNNYTNKLKDPVHEIVEPLEEGYKTYMHFKGEEEGEVWYNEITIIKEKCIIIKYGGLLILNVEDPNVSITANELKSVIDTLKTKCPYNEVTKYAARELHNLRRIMEERHYQETKEIVDLETLRNISAILASADYGNERNIFFKTKVISSEPLKMLKDKQKTFKK